MKLLTVLLTVLAFHSPYSAQKNLDKPKTDTETVYICGSLKGKRYHFTEHCRGLSNCSKKAIKTTIKQAQREGKTLCGWEK